jgi:acetyl-CoA carboxylase carboxyl transferase subunit beta
MGLFDDLKTPKVKKKDQLISAVPDGLLMRCPQCAQAYEKKVYEQNDFVCPLCQHHGRMPILKRFSLLSDRYELIAQSCSSKDPLEFKDAQSYQARLEVAQKKSGHSDAFLWAKAYLDPMPFYLGVFNFQFMGGSMGLAVGEQISCLFEKALQDRLPAVVVSASGGARMQEGIFSLMQMAKTTAVLAQLKKERIPYFSVLTDPTTGGVAASFAMLGDLILAEPQALIGFSGPRIIEQVLRQKLPEGFQRSEFLMQKGFIDRIIARSKIKNEIRQLMWHFGKKTCRFENA